MQNEPIKNAKQIVVQTAAIELASYVALVVISSPHLTSGAMPSVLGAMILGVIAMIGLGPILFRNEQATAK